jgi:hypothetical protein
MCRQAGQGRPNGTRRSGRTLPAVPAAYLHPSVTTCASRGWERRIVALCGDQCRSRRRPANFLSQFADAFFQAGEQGAGVDDD